MNKGLVSKDKLDSYYVNLKLSHDTYVNNEQSINKKADSLTKNIITIVKIIVSGLQRL